MIIIPAIDLLNGQCVRLLKGDYNEVSSYDLNPAAMAARFQKMGVRRLHLVDLDAARGQGQNNRKHIRDVRKVFSGLIEVGGGVRTAEDILELQDAGVDRLIVGTVLAKDPDLVASWIEEFGPIFIAGIDALNGEVKVSGWEKGSVFSDVDLAVKCAKMGIANIIYTNIAKDGTLAGPDLKRTNHIAEASGLAVTLSGGISSLEDMEKVCREGLPGIRGIITGKAVYEGRINVESAVKEFQKVDEEIDW
ncbi:MAG: 1-(5-phosphoribosyl)-5-[(5-phosphoribosylamino)methylideneamino]imidazole-4-carboxamide isomerase [Spirochaetaceae bacterium 4572_59]|nr:MAG: 1-(5-phosphoribosyl)-5-[(5-phosphoribosylamino)methylideneamino]imidazole-4-carboxamide isomerase [Spirochaetaceae bacterium 4572_59]